MQNTQKKNPEKQEKFERFYQSINIEHLTILIPAVHYQTILGWGHGSGIPA